MGGLGGLFPGTLGPPSTLNAPPAAAKSLIHKGFPRISYPLGIIAAGYKGTARHNIWGLPWPAATTYRDALLLPCSFLSGHLSPPARIATPAPHKRPTSHAKTFGYAYLLATLCAPSIASYWLAYGNIITLLTCAAVRVECAAIPARIAGVE